MAKPLKTQNLSAHFLKSNTQMPESFIQDYMNIANNFNIISTQFQALKDGTQATTPAFAVITGWTQERSVGGSSFDPATGELTLPATGDYVVDAMVRGDAATGIELKLQMWDGTTWNDVSGSASGDSTSAYINGFQLSASLSYKIRLMVADTGASMDITTNNARLSLQRKS